MFASVSIWGWIASVLFSQHIGYMYTLGTDKGNRLIKLPQVTARAGRITQGRAYVSTPLMPAVVSDVLLNFS